MSPFSTPMLALDTASGASACVLLPDGQSFFASMSQPRAHSRELLPMLKNVMQQAAVTWSDMGVFAVSVGPGSFTGLRVACATMAGINASLKKPMYSLCSLSITALQAHSTTDFWAIEDARSKLVYAAPFDAQGQRLQAAQCMTWDDFLALNPVAIVSLSDVSAYVPNVQVLPLKISREAALLQAVQALNVQDQHDLWQEPVYLQASQAEKNLA